MAVSLTFVLVAVQSFLTFFTTLVNQSVLAASDHSLTLSALAFYNGPFVLARRTFTSMTHQRAGMGAVNASFFIAYLSAGMRKEVSVEFWIEVFSTETIVFW